MNRSLFTLLAPLVLSLPSTGTACGPDGCKLEFTLSAQSCGLSVLPFLTPKNDTRINMAMLIADEQNLIVPAWNLGNDTEPPFFSVQNSQPLLFYPNDKEIEYEPQLTSIFAKLGFSDNQWQSLSTNMGGYNNSICQSNDVLAVEGFTRALVNASLAINHSKTLAEARLILSGYCGSEPPNLGNLPQDAIAGEFSQYLYAIRAFYGQDLDSAASLFLKLSQGQNEWIAETSHYMQIRVAIIQSQQQALNEWGYLDFNKVNKDKLQAAQKATDSYLSRYPQGRYARSAQGFYRRIAWLKQDQQQLSQGYAQLIKQGQVSFTLLTELDQRLPAPDVTQLAHTLPDWLLVQYLAILGEHRYIPFDEPSEDKQPIAADAITFRQQLQHANWQQPPLWLNYVTALEAYYLEHDYHKTLTHSQVATDAPRTWLNFSQRMLHGLALTALHDWPTAQKHWQELLTQESEPARLTVVQLALAMTLERAGLLKMVYATNTPISNVYFRQKLLSIANAPLLRDVIKASHLSQAEKETASYYLLIKNLSRQRYADFNKDMVLTAPFHEKILAITNYHHFDKSYDCPTLIKTNNVNILSSQPNAHTLNCIGDFLLQHGGQYGYIDSYSSSLPSKSDLAGSSDTFGGKANSSLDFYMQVIKLPHVSANDRAYALHKALDCFALTGYNHCGAQQISQTQRKQWFKLLKTRYKQTIWAQQQRVYW